MLLEFINAVKSGLGTFNRFIVFPISSVFTTTLAIIRENEIFDKIKEKLKISGKNVVIGASHSLNPIALPSTMIKQKHLRDLFSYVASIQFKNIAWSVGLLNSREVMYRLNLINPYSVPDYIISTAIHGYLLRNLLDTFLHSQVAQLCISNEMRKNICMKQVIAPSKLSLDEMRRNKSLKVKLLESIYQSPVYYFTLKTSIERAPLNPILQALLLIHIIGVGLLDGPLGDAALTVEDRYKYVAKRPVYTFAIGAIFYALDRLLNLALHYTNGSIFYALDLLLKNKDYVQINNQALNLYFGQISYANISITTAVYVYANILLHINMTQVDEEPLSFDFYYLPRLMTKAVLEKSIETIREAIKSDVKNPLTEEIIRYVKSDRGQQVLQCFISKDFLNKTNFRKSISGQQLIISYGKQLEELILALKKYQKIYKSTASIIIKGLIRRLISLDDLLAAYYPKIIVSLLLKKFHNNEFSEDKAMAMIEYVKLAKADHQELVSFNWQFFQQLCLNLLSFLYKMHTYVLYVTPQAGAKSLGLIYWKIKAKYGTKLVENPISAVPRLNITEEPSGQLTVFVEDDDILSLKNEADSDVVDDSPLMIDDICPTDNLYNDLPKTNSRSSYTNKRK